MDKLTVSLTAIASDGVNIDVTVAASSLRPNHTAEDVPVGDVTVQGCLQQVDSEYFFQGTLSGEYHRPCDRCLEQAVDPFAFDVIWSFEQGAPEPVTDVDEEEEDIELQVEDKLSTFTFQGNEIDLSQQVWEELALAMPTKFLCQEDCKGLCPSCGINLNDNTCSCREESMDNKGLAGLADLLPRLESKKED